MDLPELEFRRATVADLNALRTHWQEAKVYSFELEKRFTEFQIAVNNEGAVLAGVGIEIRGKQARLHTETFAGSLDKDKIRAQIWKRIQNLVENHGLLRVWTGDDDFWRENGFGKADEKTAKQGAQLFETIVDDWLTRQMRDEATSQKLAEAEFELFQTAIINERDKILGRGKVFKNVALLIVGLILLGLMLLLVFTLADSGAQSGASPFP